MPSLLYTLFETNRNLHYFCDLLMRRDFVFTVKHGKQNMTTLPYMGPTVSFVVTKDPDASDRFLTTGPQPTEVADVKPRRGRRPKAATPVERDSYPSVSVLKRTFGLVYGRGKAERVAYKASVWQRSASDEVGGGPLVLSFEACVEEPTVRAHVVRSLMIAAFLDYVANAKPYQVIIPNLDGTEKTYSVDLGENNTVYLTDDDGNVITSSLQWRTLLINGHVVQMLATAELTL